MNISNTTASYVYLETELGKIVKIIVYSVMLFLSFTGNTVIIAIIYKNSNHRMRTASNLFILNMAVSNLLLTVWNVPFSLKGIVNNHEWLIEGVFGKILCKFCMFSWFFSELVSTGSLSAIAIDRFLLVYYPTKNLLTKRISALCIALSWLIAMGFCSPVFMYSTLFEFRKKFYCIMNMGFSYRTFATYAMATFALFIATPLVIVIVLYLAIIIKLLGQKPVGENVNNERLERKRRENYRICRMLLIIVCLFSLCVLPYWAVYIYCILSPKRSMVCLSSRYFQIAFLLTFVNAGANPYIYIFCSQTFWNGAKNLFYKTAVHPETLSLSVSQNRRANNGQSARISTVQTQS